MSRPGRREQPPDLPPGPVADFLLDLRRLRVEAGSPSYRLMAARSGAGNQVRSHTTLSELTTRPQLATWDTTAAYIRGLGRDPEEWRTRWQRVQAEIQETTPSEPVDDTTVEPTDAVSEPSSGEARSRDLVALAGRSKRRMALVVAAVVLIAGAVTGATVTLARRGERQDTAVSATIVVQNMIATGANELREDTTPAYLSARTVPFCAKYKCAVPESNMWSGARLTAVCQREGARLSNADEQSAGIERNQHVARSSRWYGVRRGDGSLSYISEVYVTPKGRGGLHLPECALLGG